MALTPETRLGPYEIVAPLGAGGMGEVYRARDPRLGRDIAIKVLPDNVASSPHRLSRFEREARTVASLNHPNIVVLHSIEEVAGTRFLTMELVEGRNLAALVTPGGLALAQLLDLAIPLADALAAAHERGVVHRDLKPANVMVSREGRIKVLDFGLAKLTQVEPDLQTTQTPTMGAPHSVANAVVGTVPYMAPEQIRGEGVDARSDLFSFGILIYELATGTRPFAGHTLADVSSAILRDDPPPMTSLRADLPTDLERIVARCMEKSRQDRFQTALDLMNELLDLKRAIDRGVPVARGPTPDHVASIAVLPFVNRSANAEDEYFSDGLADELLTVLAKIRGLRVAARTSAFSFKDKDATIAEIGRTLNVVTVLEGSVRKVGSRVRISVQLVKVADGYHLWSETYDRTLDDILAVQDDIAQSVVKELRTTLLGVEADSKASEEVRAEVSKAGKGRGTSPEAHRIYLMARHLNERRAREDTAKGIQYLHQALELDPRSALAWAELGTAHAIGGAGGWVHAAEAFGLARQAVEKALSLEPDLAEAHAELGRIQMIYDRDWRGAQASIRRALEIAPGNGLALRSAGALAYNHDRLEEAIGFFSRALEQDPLSAAAYNSLALVLHAASRFAEAETAYRRALELAPQRAVTRGYLSLTLLAQGRGADALAEATQEPNELFRLWALSIVHHVQGNTAASDGALADLIEKYADVGAFQIAEVCAARADADHAFEWLERAFADGDPGLSEIKCGPLFRPLREDRRWSEWVRKMGFEG